MCIVVVHIQNMLTSNKVKQSMDFQALTFYTGSMFKFFLYFNWNVAKIVTINQKVAPTLVSASLLATRA